MSDNLGTVRVCLAWIWKSNLPKPRIIRVITQREIDAMEPGLWEIWHDKATKQYGIVHLQYIDVPNVEQHLQQDIIPPIARKFKGTKRIS